MKITSLTNGKVKALVKLREHRARKKTGLAIIDGIREIALARQAGVAIEEMYICPEILEKQSLRKSVDNAVPAGQTMTEVTPEVFHKIAFGDRAEGVLAVCRPAEKALQDIRLGDVPFIVIVESLEKPGNLGAILRSCDGAGVDALCMSGETTDIYNPNVIRSSLGTVFTTTAVETGNEEVLKFVREKRMQVVATSPSGKINYTKADLKGPLALVLGSEQKGLSEFWVNHADLLVKVPMKGQADSLNVSNTAAVLIYEVIRQRDA